VGGLLIDRRTSSRVEVEAVCQDTEVDSDSCIEVADFQLISGRMVGRERGKKFRRGTSSQRRVTPSLIFGWVTSGCLGKPEGVLLKGAVLIADLLDL
jgi:hypothetical protein